MARILFLAHRIPYPPNKGDKIRSWHFLEHLTSRHEVHLGFYVDSKKDMKHVAFLERRVRSLAFCRLGRFRRFWGVFVGLLTGQPLTMAIYPKRQLQAFVDRLFREDRVDLVFLFSAAVAPLVEGKPQHIPVIADLVDVDSEKWTAYSKTHGFPFSRIYGREARLLARHEKQIARDASVTTFVSEAEAAVFRKTVEEQTRYKISHLNNGVDTKKFDPGRFEGVPVPHSVIFTGAMDYAPNIEAAEWFVEQVWPEIRAVVPDATFIIAGAPVHSRVQSLARKFGGVETTGYVEDMAAAIAGASIVVAPLQTARGIQNKVLEGMAMAKPVVATTGAQEGITAKAGVHLRIADDGKAFAQAVISLMTDREQAIALGCAARGLVLRDYAWNVSLKHLDQLTDSLLDRVS